MKITRISCMSGRPPGVRPALPVTGHPETAAIERVVTRYRAEGIAYRTLHDGQALLVDGPETKIV